MLRRLLLSPPFPLGDLASGLLIVVGLSLLAPPPGPAFDPRNDGIGLESFRILLAALLLEKARFTCVPPAKTGDVVGAGPAELDKMLVVEEEEEEGRIAWVDVF